MRIQRRLGMDDIVTTLRTMVQFTNAVAGDVCWRAADEIERLREELEASKTALRGWIEMLGEIGGEQ
jgi:hypothetical protein